MTFYLLNKSGSAVPGVSVCCLSVDVRHPFGRSCSQAKEGNGVDDQHTNRHTNLLIDMLWEILQTTEDSPVVFYVDAEMGDTAHRLPAEWQIHDVQAASFTAQVTKALADGPVVAFPPWYGKVDGRTMPAGDALREVQPTGSNPLIAVLPASTLVLPSANALRTDLFTRWRPTIAAYAPGVIEGAHPSFIAAILQIIPVDAGTPPFRMFEHPASGVIRTRGCLRISSG